MTAVLRRLLSTILLCAAAIAAAPSAAVAQDVVLMRGGDHDGFGRLVFEFAEPTRYRAAIRDGQLRMEFARQAQFQERNIFPALDTYVGAPAPGPHGYRMTFPLKDQFGLNHWADGNKIVVDLMDPSADTPPPAMPAVSGSDIALGEAEPGETDPPEPEPTEATREEAAAPTEPEPEPAPEAEPMDAADVSLRIGQHADFDRLVFDWPENVAYSVELDSATGQTRVQFDRPAEFDLSRFAEDRPERVEALLPAPAERGSAVEATVPRGAQIRHFPLDRRVVVDVFAPGAPIPADAPGEPPEPAPSPAEETEPRGVLAEAQPDPEPEPEPEPRDRAETDPPAQVSAPPRPPAKPDAAATPDTARAADAAPRPAVEAEDGEPIPLVAPESVQRTPGAEPELAYIESTYTPEQIARGDAPKPGESPSKATPARLELPWVVGTAAAYRRGGSLWLLFEGPAPQDVEERIAAAAPRVREVNLTQLGEGVTLIEVDAAANLQAELSQAGGVWSLALAPRAMLPNRPLSVELEDDGVRVPAVAAGPAIELDDPGTGGRLHVVPLAEAGRGMAMDRRFQEFTLLSTGQGVAVVPRIDDLRVRSDDDGVFIDAADGPLQVSAERGGNGAISPIPRMDGRSLLDLPAWRQEDRPFSEAKAELQQAVSEAEGEDQALARLDLARFYFAHGLATEALAALRVYADKVDRRSLDPQVMLMTGVAEMLTGRWQRAGETLAHPALDRVPEAIPWRAAYAAVSGADEAAVSAFGHADPLLVDYPESVRKRLHLLAANARLNVGDHDGAAEELEKVRALSPNRSERAQADFIEARLALEDGEITEAEDIWARLAQGRDAPTRARSRFVMAERDLANDRKSRDEVISELEGLRFSWRGDGFEAVLLHRLADLYLEEGAYRRSLEALRQAAAHLPDTPRAQAAAERMQGIFEDLFLHGAADEMPALRALALYEAFRELTPAGEKGNRMIANLADRLVQVDLLDRAAALLNMQVRHRLSGAAKAEAGARLASVHLLDRQPQAALDALDASEAGNLPTDLRERRRHLAARALSDVGRNGEALALLQGDTSPDGLRLKADIHAEEGDWPAAAEALLALLPPAPPPESTLPAPAAQQVVRATVALTLAGDNATLASLHDRYADAMGDGSEGDTFRLLAERSGNGIDTIARQLAKVQRAQAFMNSYRDRLRDQAAALPE